MCVALLSSSVSSCTVFTWSAGASSCFLKTEREREKTHVESLWRGLWRVGWLAESLSASGGAGSQTHPGPSGTCWLRWAPAQDWSPGNRPLAPQTDLKHKIRDSRLRRLARMIRRAGAWIALTRFFRASARCDLFNFESCVPFNMIPNQIPSMCKKHLTSILFFPPIKLCFSQGGFMQVFLSAGKSAAVIVQLCFFLQLQLPAASITATKITSREQATRSFLVF